MYALWSFDTKSFHSRWWMFLRDHELGRKHTESVHQHQDKTISVVFIYVAWNTPAQSAETGDAIRFSPIRCVCGPFEKRGQPHVPDSVTSGSQRVKQISGFRGRSERHFVKENKEWKRAKT